MLVVVGRHDRRLRDLLHLPDPARQARRRAGRDRIMQNFLAMPVQASTHAAEVDQMTVLVHWLMLVLFVGWGTVLHLRAVPLPQGRQPEGELHRRQGQDLEGDRGRRRAHRGGAAGVLRDSGVGEARQGVSVGERGGRRPRRRRAVRVEHPLSRTRRQVRPDRRQAGERRQPARARSRAIRTRRTTSRRSTS